ncbi:hypothetical protein BGZ65_007238 [Modicella reniformis]|uniref:Uncharacterized protein n=1 Tax=Modicella reniformis TaxID=1440133 RepID=A0A9P6IR12_9FUNG|nr:hypothetical protein BGZ65_007238 [Modicella reniformis]
MASKRLSSQQARRYQLLAAASSSSSSSSSSQPTSSSSNNNYPKDTLGAIHYILDQLQPQRVRQHKVFPRVCMVHQLYSLIQDNTDVDRTLAQLIKENTIRKFYLGGTGSDEFAIMFTCDYVAQIQQAKEQYLKDLQGRQGEAVHHHHRSSLVLPKRKHPYADSISSPTMNKKTKPLTVGSETVVTGVITKTSTTNTASSQEQAGEIFDRFQALVLSGHCMEISIQHSRIQSVIGATDQDITTLIRYSLLNQSLSQPANPHLVNLNQPVGRSNNSDNNNNNNSDNNPTASGGRAALHQLIHATNQEQTRGVHPDTSGSPSTSSPSLSTAAGRVSDHIAFRFAIRQGGLFVTHFLKGRLEVLRMIRRQTFKDMLTSVKFPSN